MIRHGTLAALIGLALTACTSLRMSMPPVAQMSPVAGRVPPEKATEPAPATIIPSALRTFEQRQTAWATDLLARGELAEAALAWEVLYLLQPTSPHYRERLQHTQALVQAAVAERWPRAVQAHGRAEWAAAEQLYLAVLTLQPDHAPAAQALRTLERERALRGADLRRPPPQRAEAPAVHPRLRR